MNLSTTVLLLNEECRAVLGVYEPDIDGQPPKPRTMFKTFDPSIEKDDLVIVPTNTRHGMTVFKIVEVDVEVDFENPAKVDWIIDKVDSTRHALLLEQEGVMIGRIQKAQANEKREKLKAALLADIPNSIKALPIVNATSK